MEQDKKSEVTEYELVRVDGSILKPWVRFRTWGNRHSFFNALTSSPTECTCYDR